MPINEEYIFIYDDYLAIKHAGCLCCVAEEGTEYKKEGEQWIKERKEIHQKYNIPIDVDTIEKGYPILCA